MTKPEKIKQFAPELRAEIQFGLENSVDYSSVDDVIEQARDFLERNQVWQGAEEYAKYFLSVVFEAVTMALAIVICNAFISAGLPPFTGNYADWAQTLIYLCEMTFTIALTVGSVKGAQSLTSKALGL